MTDEEDLIARARRNTAAANARRAAQEIMAEGKPDQKPYKVERLRGHRDNGFWDREAEFATEAEAKAHLHLGARFRIWGPGRKIVWPPSDKE